MLIDPSTEKRFLLLKKKLDGLHYNHPFTIDSICLVDQLLNDLIKTTESFQALKIQNESLKQVASKHEQMIEPLKKEISKLTKENNDLHYQMIKVKEDCEFRENRWRNQINTLEGEKNDFKFVLQQKDTNYKKLEDDNFALRAKLDVLYKKTYSINTKGGLDNIKPEDIRPNSRGMRRSSNPNNMAFEIQDMAKGQDGDLKECIKSLRIADEKITKLKDELKIASNSKSLMEEKIRNLETQLTNRDKEIKRLHSKIDLTGISIDRISNDYNLKMAEEKIERLNLQIDFLSKENLKLENDAKSMGNGIPRANHMRKKTIDLSDRSKDMTISYDNLKKKSTSNEKTIEKVRKGNSIEENQLIEKKNREISYYKEEIENLTKKVENLLVENRALKIRSH